MNLNHFNKPYRSAAPSLPPHSPPSKRPARILQEEGSPKRRNHQPRMHIRTPSASFDVGMRMCIRSYCENHAPVRKRVCQTLEIPSPNGSKIYYGHPPQRGSPAASPSRIVGFQGNSRRSGMARYHALCDFRTTMIYTHVLRKPASASKAQPILTIFFPNNLRTLFGIIPVKH